MIQGLDLYNSNFKDGHKVDFEAIKAAGYHFVILKLTEGVDFIDPSVIEQSSRAKAAGLLVSYYHFATPGGSRKSGGGYTKWWDAEDEANDFLEALTQVPEPDLMVALDYEWKSDHIEATIPHKPDRTRWAEEWLLHVKAETGYLPMFYTYKHYMDSQLTLPSETLNAAPLWYARYGSDSSLPEDCGWERFELWQKTWEHNPEGMDTACGLNEAPHGLDEISLAPCGVPITEQIALHIKAIRAHCDAVDALLKMI